jgi:hypothetical protein
LGLETLQSVVLHLEPLELAPFGSLSNCAGLWETMERCFHLVPHFKECSPCSTMREVEGLNLS